jgi:heme exporter protein D
VTGWVWSACAVGYVAVAMVTVRVFIREYLERVARRELATRQNTACNVRKLSDDEAAERWSSVQGPLITQRHRDDAAVTGFMAGAIWPVFWAMWIASFLAKLMNDLIAMGGRKMTEGIVPSAERERLAAVTARRERQELDFLRNQARDLGLPFPGDDA